MLTESTLRLLQEYDEGVAEAVGLLDGGIRLEKRRDARIKEENTV
jgi:hypothetical protein